MTFSKLSRIHDAAVRRACDDRYRGIPDSEVAGYFFLAEKEGCPDCGGPLRYDEEVDEVSCIKCGAIAE